MGPDTSGGYRDGQVVLGHSRLSLIDLAGGTQSLANEDRSVWLVFNGEIFNYLERGAGCRPPRSAARATGSLA